AAEPEAVAAVVGLVADVSVAGAPAFHAVVVGVGAIVLDEEVAARHPAVEHADEDAVAAVADVVAVPVVVVGAAFDQHAGGIAGMDLGLGPVDADAVGEVIVQEAVAAGSPQLGTGVGAVGEIVVGDEVVVAVDQVDAVPDLVGLVLLEDAAVDAGEEDAAARRQLAPTVGGIVVVGGEVAVLDSPGRGVRRRQANGETLHPEISDDDVGAAIGVDTGPSDFERLEVTRLARALQGGAVAVDDQVTGFDDEAGVEHGVFFEL